jgi:Helicase conserved C-terminal domain
MSERAEMIAWIRGELVGPTRLLSDATIVEFVNGEFTDLVPLRRGPTTWRPEPDAEPQEVLYYDRESPHRKYGAGLLHPTAAHVTASGSTADQAAAQAMDRVGAELEADEVEDGSAVPDAEAVEEMDPNIVGEGSAATDGTDDFEVTSPDVRHPSTMGISFCVRLDREGRIIIRLPQSRRFAWQPENSAPFALNGRYELGKRRWTDDQGRPKDAPVWRRREAVLPNTEIIIEQAELLDGKRVAKDVTMPEGAPLNLRVDLFPRQVRNTDGVWLVTAVLRNSTPVAGAQEPREAVLFQTYFEVGVKGGRLEKYPESQRPFAQLDPEEQSLVLLYRESATWGIGHGCAAGWDAETEQSPSMIFSDVLPAVQLPSMTPDIEDANGGRIELSMRVLASLSNTGEGSAWQSLENLASEYEAWIQREHAKVSGLNADLAAVANRHLADCGTCLIRINAGIALLRNDERIRRAFRLANLAMLLQQIATKQLIRRPLNWNAVLHFVGPDGNHWSPWNVFENNQDTSVGSWRAFQIAFLLMSLEGIRDGRSPDREIVDLIWFPTGGGKTEAYLAVMSFYMFHERLLMEDGDAGPRRDGTNVLMRYTLRMLTTQQFQRAASLICGMEFLRRNPQHNGIGKISGERFSLGLWIGGDGSPNKIAEARNELGAFRRGDIEGNPLVLTECPWCRSAIGRYEGARPNVIPKNQWNGTRTRGITDDPSEGPRLQCPDPHCAFGGEYEHLPVEVIDERIYRFPPSLVIATADKLAMIAYRPGDSTKPGAGALFGRSFVGGQPRQQYLPPGLIIQDELHLISGPLGTMYALYEGIFERLCSLRDGDRWIKPKLIASTATIRGAEDQVKALYARTQTQLFPSPGLLMGDSFFGKYARIANGRLCDGRLYLGIHASDYGSVLTTQVRAFSSALFRPFSFAADRRDPWWSLLVFYNSIRELGGAKTLFDSDIRSRLKFMFNRENFPHDNRRRLMPSDELTSRLSQAEIVGMMDKLAVIYSEVNNKAFDACLASNIIEVGVDIERLSLMGVVGQPKTTAQYIQVTGRVGRKWWERAGLILMIYNPSKSRDRSHFEQFHSYHRRLYERVEPTSATPFALSAIQRALPGALIAWARQHSDAPVQKQDSYSDALETAHKLLRERCLAVQTSEDQGRSLQELARVREELEEKWSQNPQLWEEYPPKVNGEYLMLWPGQFASALQKRHGVVVPSSMRQVDGSAELNIAQGYALENPPVNP